MAQGESAPAPELKFADLGDFKLESGATIRDCRIGYHTLGKSVMGISMGGMQTFQWIVSYPDFVDKAVPIVGSPRLTAYDLLLWRSEESAIEEDKDWNGGNYTTQPHLNAVAEIHNLALTTPSYRTRETAANKFPEFLDGVDKDGLGRMTLATGSASSKR